MDKDNTGTLLGAGILGFLGLSGIIALFGGFFIIIAVITSVLGIVSNQSPDIHTTYKDLNMTQIDFINRVGHDSLGLYKKYKIFPSVSIAQAILESGWGKSGLTEKSNNLFGIKASSDWAGPVYTIETTEHTPYGVPYQIIDDFRVYPNWKASIDDHAAFLLENSRYTEHGVFSAKTNYEQVKAIKAAGYATDVNYVNLVMDLIKNYELDRFDQSFREIERQKLIDTGRLIVGKVPYFWGGRSSAGINPDWGKMTLVSAPGSDSTGQYRPLGLDCSGFVDWDYKTAGAGNILVGTTKDQWEESFPIAINELLPGDLGFKNIPGKESVNHVGIFSGMKDGKKTFIHSAGGTGVTENQTTVFKYWRRPTFVIFKGE